MPYIRHPFRRDLKPHAKVATNPGELNFQVTSLVDDYVLVHGLSYHTINDVLGALEGAKLEFYRRIAAPYEDEKIERNGDVYTSRGS
jgi:hypothetical protein